MRLLGKVCVYKARLVFTTDGLRLQQKVSDYKGRLQGKVRDYKRSFVITTEAWILQQKVVIATEGLVWLRQQVCDDSRFVIAITILLSSQTCCREHTSCNHNLLLCL